MHIKFSEAIYVAVIRLIVNGKSAFFLKHDHEQNDHNIRSAYLHVLANGLTSVTATIAFTAGMFYNFYSPDAIGGIISLRSLRQRHGLRCRNNHHISHH